MTAYDTKLLSILTTTGIKHSYSGASEKKLETEEKHPRTAEDEV